MTTAQQSTALPASEDTHAFVDKETERWVLAAAISASAMAFINSSSLNVALPALQRALGAGGSALLWIVNAYALMLAALILLGGSLGDKLGRKKIFMIGIIVFMIGTIACGAAPTSAFLIAARTFQGIGGAMVIPGSLAIITAAISPERRGAAIGWWSTAITITAVAGPVLGGFLAEAGLWRAVFLINIPFAVAALYLLYRYVPESRDPDAPTQIDYPGAVLATLGLAGIAFGFTSAPHYGFSDPRIFGSLIAGTVFLVGFVYVQSISDHPMMSLHLFKSKTFSGTNLLTLFLYGSLSAFSFFFSLNLIQVQQYPESIAGFVFLPFSLILAGMSRWSGGLVDKIGPKIPLTIGPILVGIAYVYFGLIGLTDGPQSYWTTYFPPIIINAVGMGIVVAPLTTAVMGSVSSHHAGTASGVNNAVSRTAGVLAVAILGSVALFTFSLSVANRIADLNLPAEVESDVLSQTANLGDATAPESVPSDLEPEVNQALRLGFLDTFQLVMFINAGLAFFSAAMAAVLVENRLVEMQDDD